MTALDPTLHGTLRIGLALLFAAAAAHKLRDPAGFLASLRDYRLLPRAFSAPAAAALVVAEAGAAGLLLWPAPGRTGAVVAMALLALYALAIGWNLARGRRHIDCGCLGPGRRQAISAWLVARNGALFVGASLLLGGSGSRETSWVDALSLLGSVTLLVLLWKATHQLGALRAAVVQPASGRSV